MTYYEEALWPSIISVLVFAECVYLLTKPAGRSEIRAAIMFRWISSRVHRVLDWAASPRRPAVPSREMRTMLILTGKPGQQQDHRR